MARVGTSNHDLGMWEQGENPGAGTQDQAAIGKGLNDNFKKIDNATSKVNDDGTLKNAVVFPANLDATVADGSTIVQDGTTKKLKVPNFGIDRDQIAAAAVTVDKIAADAVDTSQLVDGAVVEVKIGTGVVSTRNLADRNVTPGKMSHDNASRKGQFVFCFTNLTPPKWGTVGAILTDSSFGIPLTKPGSVTAIYWNSNGPASGSATKPYASSGPYHFSAGAYLNVLAGGGLLCNPAINGLPLDWGVTVDGASSTIFTVEVEWDD